MPRKMDPDATYGEKLIRLFSSLLFSRRPHSQTELAEMLDCSKQSVTRLLNDISRAYQIEIERIPRGREATYAIKKKTPPPAGFLSESEMNLLWMCRAFTERLLGKDHFGEVQEALYKSQTLVKGDINPAEDHFASFFPGTIDYTPQQENIRTLVEAMKERHVCKVVYKAAESVRAKTYHIKPLKIFCYKDTLYLHALRAKDPWQKKWMEPEFDPLLAIHRFKKIKKADRSVPFEAPKKYDFEKAFNKSFGIIKEKSFTVEAEFTGWAAVQVAERTWSPDQVITKNGDAVTVKFTASSGPETLSWILSFGDNGRLLGPDWLVGELAQKVGAMGNLYSTGKPKKPKGA